MRCLLFLALVAGCADAPAKHRALVIGIDGMRPDALERAVAPNLKSLMRTGAFTLRATTQLEAPTKSGPGWASILTGVDANKHRVVDNQTFPARDRAYPSMLARAKTRGLRTAAVCNWFPLITELVQDEKSADYEVLAPADSWVTDEAVLALGGDFDLVFVHLDDVDKAGHSTGFSIDNPDYLAAVETKDAQVGAILTALGARKDRAAWLVVVATDHGGAGRDHGPLDADNRTIPLIFDGPGVKAGALPEGASHTDVTPTVLSWLGLPADPAFDGKILALK